jgi:signal transduction histidine kinase
MCIRDRNIIGMNMPAEILFRDINLLNQNIKKLLNDIDLDEVHYDSPFEISINGKYYSTTVKNIEELGYKQIYLHDITKRQVYEQQIRDYQKNLKELHKKVNSSNEQEKERIGKELHDGVGHSLSLLKMEMQNFFITNKINLDDKKADKMLRAVDKLSNEVRELSHQLKPRILSEFGLVPALRSLVDRINSSGKLKGFVNQENELMLIDENIEKTIYRICQEALNNIIKHSDCREFSIDISNDSDSLKVVISDDGKGFNVNEKMRNGSTSLGLLNMKERADAIGAGFSIDSIQNMGTSIYLKVDTGKN